jgi:heme A synthase
MIRPFAIATAVATFLLLLIGGLVNPTGSSLACPDWPLCHGSAFPEMTGGVFFEHSHRLAATTVGLMTIVLAVLLVRDRRRDPGLARLGVLAVVLVCLQGVLGGLTVLLELPDWISVSHLGLSMLFFLLLVYIAVRAGGAPKAPVPPRLHRTFGECTFALWLQIVLGGVMRHTGTGMACATDIPLCHGALWPSFAGGQIHMAHRLFGVLVGLFAISVGVRAAQKLGGSLRRLGIALPILVVAQIGLGVWTVLSGIQLHVVEAHLAVGVLLLAATAILAFRTRGAAS